jgi:hypothetical protein
MPREDWDFNSFEIDSQCLQDDAYRPLYTIKRKIQNMLINANYTKEWDWFNRFYCAVLTIVPILLTLTVLRMRDDVYIGFICVENQGWIV